MAGRHVKHTNRRLESGRAAPRLSLLQKVVEALGGELEIKISNGAM